MPLHYLFPLLPHKLALTTSAMPSARQRAAAAKARAAKKKKAAKKGPVKKADAEPSQVAPSKYDEDTEDAVDYKVGGYHPVKVRQAGQLRKLKATQVFHGLHRSGMCWVGSSKCCQSWDGDTSVPCGFAETCMRASALNSRQ